MLRYALRRLLWAIPTLVATSLVLFFVTTLAPDPALQRRGHGADDPDRNAALEEARRARFLDLPRFFNASPTDVRSRTREALSHIAASDAVATEAGEELRRLGGAAFPYVFPLLETLSPDARRRVAVELAPVAERMGVTGDEIYRRPDTAILFWTRFWENRSLDFTRAAVSRAVLRLVEHGSDLRERDLAVVDTFSLPELIAALSTSGDPETLSRLTRLLRHVTSRGRALTPDAGPEEARRVVAEWQEWWFVHANDFVALDGLVRATAVVADTRYGRWLERARSGELGVSAVDGEPIADKLRARAPVTLLVCALAMLVSWTVAVPLGAVGAWRQGRPVDVVAFSVLFVLYATPAFAVAALLRRAAPEHASFGTRMALAIVALSVGSLATLCRWQRAAMLEVIRQDYVRTAHAKGLSAFRVATVHALRNSLQPMVALAGLHLPVLLGGSFVIEEIFGLPGVGYETLRAIEAHDAPWLMAVVLAAALAVTFGLVASDLVSGGLDPRVREVLFEREGRGAR